MTIALNDQLARFEGDRTIQLCWEPPSPHRRREIVQGGGETQSAMRPMRSEARNRFAAGFSNASLWLDQLLADPNVTIAMIATREKRTERSVRQALSLTFLDPALVETALEARLPRGFGLKRLLDLPAAWPEQWTKIGLASPATSQPI